MTYNTSVRYQLCIGNFEVTLMASSVENFKQYGPDPDEILWIAALEAIRT